MRILGIDPAYSGPAGFAVYDTDEPMLVLHTSVLEFKMNKHKVKADERIRLLWQAAERLVVFWKPDAVACEGAYLGPNAQTTIGLAKAIGGLRYMAIANGLRFVEVAEVQQRGIVETYPLGLVQRWVGHLTRDTQTHAVDAIAIAQHAAGVAARMRMEVV